MQRGSTFFVFFVNISIFRQNFVDRSGIAVLGGLYEARAGKEIECHQQCNKQNFKPDFLMPFRIAKRWFKWK
jgi:hypothetical protein